MLINQSNFYYYDSHSNHPDSKFSNNSDSNHSHSNSNRIVCISICEISHFGTNVRRRKRLHSRISRGGIINTSVGSIFLSLSTVVGTFFLSLSLPTHRETLHQRAMHVNAITLKMKLPHRPRNNFRRAYALRVSQTNILLPLRLHYPLEIP